MSGGPVPLTGALDEERIAALRAAGVTVSEIGRSAEGRPLHGCQIGDPDRPLLSIVAGAHPDEPAGPVAALACLQAFAGHAAAWDLRLAVVPILDVDGTAAQQGWLAPWSGAIEPLRYLERRLRRLPGQDREFAWPGAPWTGTVLPECAAADAFFRAAGPPAGHLSLHGMAVARGAWFLLEPQALRDPLLWQDLRSAAGTLGLHDDQRHGEKGFRRAGCGFSTAPSGAAMRRHFLARGDRPTAAGFGYGSIEAATARARAAGAPAPLAAVTEFPLLRVSEAAAPTMDAIRGQLAAISMAHDPAAATRAWLRKPGVRAVPLEEQVSGICATIDALAATVLRRAG